MSGHFDSSRGSLVSSNLLCRKWSYWELREKEGSSKPLWTELIHKLFDFNTVEEFHQCLMYQPKISDVFTSKDGSSKRCKVERTVDGKTKMIGVKAYIVMRKDVFPDYKTEMGGKRPILNAYTINVSAGDMHLEDFTEKVWDRMCHLLIGEKLDPAECINGVWLEDTSKGSKGNVALKLEVWFAIRDDNACIAICEDLRRELNDSVTQENMFGERNVLVRIPEFKKHSYFSEYNPAPGSGKHKFEKPGDFQGGELGGLPDGDLPPYPAGFLVNPPQPRLHTFGAGGGGGGGGFDGVGGRDAGGGGRSAFRGGGRGLPLF